MYFQQMKLSEALSYPELHALIDEYAKEANYASFRGEFDPEFFEALERNGLEGTAVFDDVGTMIGFFTIMPSRTAHANDQTMAVVESLFITQSARKGTTGLRVLREIKSRAKALGASTLLISSRPGSNLERLCEISGLVRQNVIWAQKL